MLKTKNLLASLGVEIPALEATSEGWLRGGFRAFDAVPVGKKKTNPNCNCGCSATGSEESDETEDLNPDCNCACSYNPDCNCVCNAGKGTETKTSVPGVSLDGGTSFLF